MWLCERKVSIPSAGARERKWVIKPGGKKRPRRRAGASDSGIHLIALKWKRFLASRSLCLKKSQIKSPHVYQPGSDFSSSSMSANPSFFFFYFSAAIGNIIINIEKAAVHRQQMPKGGSNSALMLIYGGQRSHWGKKISILVCWRFLSWRLFRLLPDRYNNK